MESASKTEWRENHLLLSEAIQVCLNYETALFYASIMLDTGICNLLNPKITQEWEGIRQRYCQ